MSKLKIGDDAPDFSMQTGDGQTITLKDFKDKILVLYFYPKDDTPGCTIEAQDFNGKLQDFNAKGIEVVGVSRDSVASHNDFCRKYDLSLILASDSEGLVCDRYGVTDTKSIFGRSHVSISRTTFLIDKQSKIIDMWPNVSVNNHAMQVLERASKIS